MQASLPEANPGGHVSRFQSHPGAHRWVGCFTSCGHGGHTNGGSPRAACARDLCCGCREFGPGRSGIARGAVGLSQLEGKGRRYLDYVQSVAKRYGVDCTTLLLRGIPHARITEVARDRGIDLVVLGASINPGRSRALTGSTACDVIASVPCSVLFVK